MSEGTTPMSNGRMDRLDERVNNLSVGFGKLESQVQTGFVRVEESVASLARQVSAGRTTNWSAIATWAGVVVAFGVAVYAPVLRSISNIDEKVEGRITIREAELIRTFERERADHLLSDIRRIEDRAISPREHEDLQKRMDALSARVNELVGSWIKR